MTFQEFKQKLRHDTNDLKRCLSAELVERYTREELELIAYILATTKDFKTAIKVTESYSENKKPPLLRG